MMDREQSNLIAKLANIIELMASDPSVYDVEYIKEKYLWDLADS